MSMYDLDKIKEISIEDVCNIYGVELTRNGQNLWGKIRNEKTSSFSINPDKNIWRDWGLSIGGDVISLVAALENVSNGRAINILGERFNIPKEESTETYTLPTETKFKIIGISSQRSILNMDINLENQSVDELKELENKYSMTMYELSKSDTELYHKLIDDKALPIIEDTRNRLVEMVTKYLAQTEPLEKELYKQMVEELKSNLDEQTTIYNKSRLDETSISNIKLDNSIDTILGDKGDTSKMNTENTVIEPHSEDLANKDNNTKSEELYRYYLTQRPPSIGTQPRGAVSVESFDNKKDFEGINCWGYVEYEKPLTKEQMEEYELTEGQSNKLEKGAIEMSNSNELEQTEKLVFENIKNLKEGDIVFPYAVSNGVNIIETQEIDYSNLDRTYCGLNTSTGEEVKFTYADIEAIERSGVQIDREEIPEGKIKNSKPLIDMKIDKDVDVTEILDNLKNGVGNIFNNENFTKYLDFQSHFYNYSPNNSLLIALQNPNATDVASFTKWNSLGRSVNKGEKGIIILQPRTVNFGAKQILEHLEKNNRINIGKYCIFKNNECYNILYNSKSIKTNLSKSELQNFITVNNLKATCLVGFKKAYVFDVSQTNGKEIPQFKINLLKDDNQDIQKTVIAIKNQIENCINSKGINLEYISDTGSANGYFSPGENKICVNSTMSLSQQTKTLVHEYVHSQLHKDSVESKDNLSARQTAEIEAESTAYVVAKHFEFDTSEYSFDYVSTWARGKEVKELEDTLKVIKTTAESIIKEIKNPLELELYNNKETVSNLLNSENVKPNDKMINNIIDINKVTGKINTVSDLRNAERFKSYGNDKELNSKITDTNKDIKDNTVIKENVIKIEIER